MSKQSVFYFHVPFNNVSARVDRQSGVIRGVAVITAGVTAKGHNLEIDEKTLDQIVECGKAKGRVQVKLNHRDPQALQSICGYIDGFRKEGNKVLADWHLLKSHEEYEKTLEKAEVMPDCFGLSAAFAGPEDGEKIGKKKAARCEELLAVDCVPMPAANPDGLFEAKFDEGGVDNSGKGNMDPKSQNQTNPEPTIADVMAELKSIRGEISGLTERQEQFEDMLAAQQPVDREELDALAQLTDDELAAQGLTRAEVQEAIAALGAEDAGGDTAADAAAAAAAGSTAPAPAMAEMAAMRRRMVELETRLGANAEANELSEIMEGFDVLEEKFDAQVELNAQLQGQVQALQRSLKLQGGKAATAGTESIRMFSADEADTEGLTEFEVLVNKHRKELSAKDPKMAPGTLKATAIRLAMKENKRAYALHRKEKGAVTLADD